MIFNIISLPNDKGGNMNAVKKTLEITHILDGIVTSQCIHCTPKKNVCDLKQYGSMWVATKVNEKKYAHRIFYGNLLKYRACSSHRKSGDHMQL